MHQKLDHGSKINRTNLQVPQRVFAAFFSTALRMTRYITAIMIMTDIPQIQTLLFLFVCCQYQRCFAISNSCYFLLRFYSTALCSYQIFCWRFSSYFYLDFIRFYYLRFFSFSIYKIRSFQQFYLIPSTVSPFLFFRLASSPICLPLASNRPCIVCRFFKAATCRAVFPSLFWALMKNCFYRLENQLSGWCYRCQMMAIRMSPLLCRTDSIRQVLSSLSVGVILTLFYNKKSTFSAWFEMIARLSRLPYSSTSWLGSNLQCISRLRISFEVWLRIATQNTVQLRLFFLRGFMVPCSSNLFTKQISFRMIAVQRVDQPSLLHSQRSTPGKVCRMLNISMSWFYMLICRRFLPDFPSRSFMLRVVYWSIQDTLSIQPFLTSLLSFQNFFIWVRLIFTINLLIKKRIKIQNRHQSASSTLKSFIQC